MVSRTTLVIAVTLYHNRLLAICVTESMGIKDNLIPVHLSSQGFALRLENRNEFTRLLHSIDDEEAIVVAF